MDVITFPENRKTTSGLQILLHGVISLPDATSYDKVRLWLTLAMVKRNCTPDNDNLYYIRGGGINYPSR